MKPILVGVDGGADALLEFGYTPDVIVGDMDSVSDEALKKKSQRNNSTCIYGWKSTRIKKSK